MKLIFIYGPPAAGKLTVAKELSKITAYKVFHNHLINDLIDIGVDIDDNEDYYWKIANQFRLKILNLALNNNKDLILTFCYAKGEDENNVQRIVNIARKYKGKIYFVHLIPHKKELMKRVINKSRKQYGKLKHRKKLKNILKKWDFYKPVLHSPNLSIDNTNLSPSKVAKIIKKHYRL